MPRLRVPGPSVLLDLVASLVAAGLVACGDDPAPAAATDASVDATDAAGDTGPDTSVGEGGETGDGGDAACKLVKAYSSKNAVCNACAEARCCAEINGCLGDKRCDDDYVNCILACALLPADAGDAGDTTKACLAKCGADFPAGKALYDTAIGCADKQCAKECG